MVRPTGMTQSRNNFNNMRTPAHSIDGRRGRGRFNKLAKKYLFATLGCALFSIVYELFSHDVYSNWMIWMFAVPLFMGAIPSLLMDRSGKQSRSVSSQKAWGSAVLTLVLGFCISGVLEIYGTTSPYVIVYWIAAAAMIVISITLWAAARR
ncbi:MAG: hypothetical protein ACOYIK_08225 [Coriobacteriales bacterium]|jgi:Na+/glutamate symporter